MRAAAVAVCAVALTACGGGARHVAVHHKVLIPARSVTSGDRLLRYVPAGAEVLFELDIRRLRENPVVGPLLTRWLASMPAQGGAPKLGALPGGAELLTKTDLVVIAAYAVGTARAATLTLARGERLHLAAVPHAVAVDATTIALGPTALLDRVHALAARKGKGKSVMHDRRLLRARALAMPAKATTGAVRLSGELDFDARVGMARMFDLDNVPAVFSVWGDVIDDLAVVAVLGGTNKADAAVLARAATQWRARFARNPAVRELLLSRIVSSIDVSVLGAVARVVLVIAPKRLQALSNFYTQELK